MPLLEIDKLCMLRMATASRCCTASASPSKKGEFVTLIGANGAGKTTTLRSIMGLLARAVRLDPFRRTGTLRASPRRRSRASASRWCRRVAAFSRA